MYTNAGHLCCAHRPQAAPQAEHAKVNAQQTRWPMRDLPRSGMFQVGRRIFNVSAPASAVAQTVMVGHMQYHHVDNDDAHVLSASGREDATDKAKLRCVAMSQARRPHHCRAAAALPTLDLPRIELGSLLMEYNCGALAGQMKDPFWTVALGLRIWILRHRLHWLLGIQGHALDSHQLVTLCHQIMQHLHDVIAVGFPMGILFTRQRQLALVRIIPASGQ